MAKNYTFAEACAIINEGTNIEAIADIGRRYPILLHKVSRVTAIAGADFVDLMSYMPDYLTANKVNSALKATGPSTSDEDASDETDETNETETDEAETGSGGMPDYDSMSAKQLWDILGKAGKRKTAKSTKKADLVAACKALHDAGSDDETDDDGDEAEAAEESSNPYEGKSAMDLFKLCKQRGIKAAPKKKAEYYVELLTKADAEAAEDDSKDDWDDEAETADEPKSAKGGKPGKGEKKAGKPGKKENDDGDDDWDI